MTTRAGRLKPAARAKAGGRRCAARCLQAIVRSSFASSLIRRPGPGEVVLAIKASGLCGSDLKFYRPAPGEAQRALGLGDVSEPLIGGHEPCGVVEAVGPGVSEAEAQARHARHVPPLRRLRRLQALPGRLVAALPRTASWSMA